jgi:hypothetical protein
VEVDVREGLLGKIDLVYGIITWHQKVYYWRLPFRCHGFHEIRHLCSQCYIITPLQQTNASKWKTKSKIKKYEIVEVGSMEGKKESCHLDINTWVLSSQAPGDLDSQAPTLGIIPSVVG